MTLELLIVQTDSTYPEIVTKHGDYADWFKGSIDSSEVAICVVDCLREALPDATEFDAIILAGSFHSVNESLPEIASLRTWAGNLVELQIPTLGVCFGHQLLVTAMGGQVARHHLGRQFGSVDIRLTAAGQDDFLFEGVEPVGQVHVCHEDQCTVLPSGATLLASSERTPAHSFAIGANVRTVQFHPEVSPALMGSLRCVLQAKQLLGACDDEHAPVSHNKAGLRILANFLNHATLQKRAALLPNPN